MKIDVQALLACGVAPAQAKLYAEPLAAACSRFAIDEQPRRVAALVAQCYIESAGFTKVEEDLRYRDPGRAAGIFRRVAKTQAERERILRPLILAKDWKGFASVIYAGVLGNGPPGSGDGWRYRGRGLKQLTGRSNYRAAGEALGRPYEAQPELVALPEDACLTAAWFWSTIDGNILADTEQIDLITKRVNGPAMLAATERRERFEQGLQGLLALA